MSELTALREAVDALAGRSLQPDFGELRRRASHRGRRRIAIVAAATAAVIVAAVLVVTRQDDHHRVAPIKPPRPNPTAQQIVAVGHLYDFGVTATGDVLAVFTNCEHELDPHCGHAWRLVTHTGFVATGIVAMNRTHAYVTVDAGRDAFVVNSPHDISLRITLDGTATSLTDCLDAPPPLDPERLAWHWGRAWDTAGVFCTTNFGTGDTPDQSVNGRWPTGSVSFTADGRAWAMLTTEDGRAPAGAIGTFDGHRWRYHHLAVKDGDIAAAGSTVVVLGESGMALTTDNGRTWHQVTDRGVLQRRMPFLLLREGYGCCAPSMAFAGSSTLYVSGSDGGLWRSDDFTTFRRVKTPGPVMALKSAGGQVFARVSGPDGLLRITADGRVHRLDFPR